MFDIIDAKTGKYPNLERIALIEDWAKNLNYCDMGGFFLGEDGNLILADECGNWAYAPSDRFVVFQNDWKRCEEELPDIGAWCFTFTEPCFYAIALYLGEGSWKKDNGQIWNLLDAITGAAKGRITHGETD